uniref:Secreted protein n=1 Tax=Oreochromis aureus TaxID=47969 RepID=A0A668T024_OREAU
MSLGNFYFFLLVPAWDYVPVSASNKLFYRKSPVSLFCSCTVQAPQKKWLPCRCWKKRGKKCKGNRLQKRVGSTARRREGGSWRKGLRRFNRGELKLRHN